MLLASKRSPETLTQSQFLTALRSGRNDFSGVTFTERVNLNQFTAGISTIAADILDFSHCDLGPDFGLGDVSVNTLIMEHARSAGKVCLFRVTTTLLYAKHIHVQEWFSLIHSTIDGSDLTRGQFQNGLCIKANTIDTLILDGVTALQTLIDDAKQTIKTLSTFDANLGRRTPTTLGEVF